MKFLSVHNICTMNELLQQQPTKVFQVFNNRTWGIFNLNADISLAWHVFPKCHKTKEFLNKCRIIFDLSYATFQVGKFKILLSSHKHFNGSFMHDIWNISHQKQKLSECYRKIRYSWPWISWKATPQQNEKNWATKSSCQECVDYLSLQLYSLSAKIWWILVQAKYT